MQELIFVLLILPYLLLCGLLASIGVVYTILDLIGAVKRKDYKHTVFLVLVTTLTVIIGWNLGGSI